MILPLVLLGFSFSLCLWFGLYLIARNHSSERRLIYTGLGLVSFALSIVTIAFSQENSNLLLERVRWALIFFPAIFWTGTLIELLSDEYQQKRLLQRLWNYSFLPLSALFFVIGISTAFVLNSSGDFNSGFYLFAVLVTLPMLIAYVLLAKEQLSIKGRKPLALLLVITLFFSISLGALFMPSVLISNSIGIALVGFDLLVLAFCIAYLDAFEQGEKWLPDLARSGIATAVLSFVLGLQVLFVMAIEGQSTSLTLLFFSSLALATLIENFHGFWQTSLDKLVFSDQPKVLQDRQELRAASTAVLRSKDLVDFETMPTDEFTKLTRKALSNFGTLDKLAASPLTQLPVITERLAERGARDGTLERAQELKQLLAEAIQKLKPQTGEDFGDTEEWRYYNVLFFPYLMGVKPFSQRADHSRLDDTSRAALDYFQMHVPERSFYNWQKVGAGLVAEDLKGLTTSNTSIL